MPSEQKHLSIILKKQPLNEGDELISIYTEHSGKLRVMAKSLKFSKSRLQHALQTLFLTEVSLAGKSSIPTVIGAEVVNAFPRIRENLESAKISFYAIELTLKFTPDSEPNNELFLLLKSFLEFLNQTEDEVVKLVGLARFKIHFLQALGLGIQIPDDQHNAVAFSNSRGGFVTSGAAIDAVPVSTAAYAQFLDYSHSTEWPTQPCGVAELQQLLSGFLAYQLERDIRSESFLNE